MKKSILIGALAALMLFAFVACDGNSGATTLEDYVVTDITVTSEIPTYFKGQKADASLVTADITTLAGTTRAASEKELNVTLDTNVTETSDKTGEPVKIGTVKFAGFAQDDLSTPADVMAYVYTLDEIKVAGPQELETYYVKNGDTDAMASTKVNVSEYTVTGNALDDKTGAVLYTAELVYDAKEDGSADTDSEYTVSFPTTGIAVGGAKLTFKAATALSATATDDFDIILVEDALESLALDVKPGVKIVDGCKWVSGDNTANDANIGQSELFTVTATFKSGVVEENYTATVSFDNIGSDNTFVGGRSYAATVKVGEISTQQIVNVGEREISKITATYTSGKVVKPGEAIDNEYVTIKADWLYGLAKEGWEATSFTVSNNGVMPDYIATTGSYPFAVSIPEFDGYAFMTVSAGEKTDHPEA